MAAGRNIHIYVLKKKERNVCTMLRFALIHRVYRDFQFIYCVNFLLSE